MSAVDESGEVMLAIDTVHRLILLKLDKQIGGTIY